MRIIEVINSINYRGGAQVLLNDLVESFRNHGHDVLVISIYGNVDQSFNNLKIVECNKKRKIDFASAKRLKKLIKDFNPDVVHFHLNCLTTYFLAFGFRKQNWNVYETIHSVPNAYTNKPYRFLRKIFVKRKILNFVAISDSLKLLIDQQYKTKFYCVYNGIKLQDFSKKNVEKKYDLLIVAHMTPIKNHKLLFNSIKELKNENIFLKLACVGDGELLEENKKFVLENGLQNSISFLGAFNDCTKLYCESKIFVLSSIVEGNPISILEAMNAGLPIVAPRVGGIGDVVKENRNGLLFDVNDLNGLKNAIKKLICDKELCDSMRLNNKKDVLDYDIDIISKQYISIFNNK